MAFFFSVLKNLNANSNDGSDDDDSRGDKRNNDDGGDSSRSDDGGTDDDDSTKLRLEPRCRLRLRRERLPLQRSSLRFAWLFPPWWFP